MAYIKQIKNFLKNTLDPNNIDDYSMNGIQIETDHDISSIAFAVDTSIESINQAIANNCQLLFVHHGLFWGKPLSITGTLKKRIKLFLINNIGLITYHLPLDAHSEYGNNAQILKKLGLNEMSPFGYYKGVNIGWQSQSKRPLMINDILLKLGLNENEQKYPFKFLDLGNEIIYKIAVVSGGGGKHIYEAIENDVDLFITGDPDHTLYHTAKENNINLLFAGHYFTETFGIRAMEKVLNEEFSVKTIFCDVPTGL